MPKRKIAVVTGTRADYGHLFWLLKEIDADTSLELQLIVTGAHLSRKFGETARMIEADGFSPAREIPIDLDDDSPVGVSRSLAQTVSGATQALEYLRPELLVLLGDRYEILGAALGALLTRTPIAHLHGGESSEGLIDEAIRHSVTKMAHFHFVAAERYRKRVIQLGEDPSRVMNFGAPGLDHIQRSPSFSRDELERKLGFNLGERFLLVTYHPVTLEPSVQEKGIQELLAALDGLDPSIRLVFTGSNADPENSVIGKAIARYVASHENRAFAAQSLGQQAYLSAIRESHGVVGNSSSGIIEAPALRAPTVNIGKRQQGRIRAESVIDCGDSREEIGKALRKALSAEFRSILPNVVSPYGQGNASTRIKDFLAKAPLDGILLKRFNEL